MSEPVYMQIPVPNGLDPEMGVIAACLYIIDRNPIAVGCSRALTTLEKERIVRYLAERFSANGSGNTP